MAKERAGPAQPFMLGKLDSRQQRHGHGLAGCSSLPRGFQPACFILQGPWQVLYTLAMNNRLAVSIQD